MADKVALVTGAQGFIGRHLVHSLLAQGWTVVGVDRRAPGPGQRSVPSRLRLLRVDVAEPSFRPLLAQIAPHCVVHLAAQSSLAALVRDPVQGLRDNVLATANVLEGSVTAGISKLVFASSAAVYGNPRILPTPESAPVSPQSAYGWTKATAEQLVLRCAEETPLACTVLRFANCYGPGQEEKDEPGVVVSWLEALRRKVPLPLAQGPERTRDFVYVGDVVEAVILAMTAEDWGVFNVSTGVETGLTELAVLAAQSSGSAPQFEALRGQPGDIERSSLDPSFAAQVLGWAAETPVAAGVALTWDYLLSVRPRLRRAAGNS